MEHTAIILKLKQGLVASLLKLFAMFEMCLIDYRDTLEAIAIMCINCKKATGLFLRTSTFE